MNKGILCSVFTAIAALVGYVYINRQLEDKRDFR